MKIRTKNLKSKLHTAFKLQPLSLRAIFTICISLICLFYYGKYQSDLIALTIGTTISLCLFVALFSIIGAFRSIFKPFKNFNDYSNEHENYYSQITNSCPIFLPQVSIPPFFQLKIKRSFEKLDQAHDISIEQILKGSFSKSLNNKIINDHLKFPRRGEYKQTGFILTFQDSLGLTRISKFIPSPRVFKIKPLELNIRPLPIMAASAQLGDIEHSALERTGDLFDIREYQPGDSLKRVLWKVYARSNHVVVRQPEPAIVPEGEVALFVLARPDDDDVASTAISYLKILEDQNIVYTVSCLGNLDSRAGNTIEDSIDLIVRSAENSSNDFGKSYSSFLSQLVDKNFSAKNIIIFLAEELSNSETLRESDIELLNFIANSSSQQNLSLSLAVVPKHQKLLISEAPSDSAIKRLDSRLNTFTNSILSLNTYSKIKMGNSRRVKNLSKPTIFNDNKITQVEYADF